MEEEGVLRSSLFFASVLVFGLVGAVTAQIPIPSLGGGDDVILANAGPVATDDADPDVTGDAVSPRGSGGACCMAELACQDDSSQAECDAVGGVYQGGGTGCATADCPVIIPFGHDCWWDSSSCTVGASRVEFGGLCPNPPIPAGFFGSGSDPFVGTVTLERGFTDTVVLRMNRLVLDPCDSVPMEMAQLSLAGCAPITVTYNGGQNPELWDVTQLGIRVASPGTVTACVTHSAGGIFSSELFLDARFEFTRTDGGAPLIWEPPAIQLVATDEPFLHGPLCADLSGCNHYFCPGHALDDSEIPCCVEVCYTSPSSPSYSLCLLPPPGALCERCPQQGAEVPTVSEWGLIATGTLIVGFGGALFFRRSRVGGAPRA